MEAWAGCQADLAVEAGFQAVAEVMVAAGVLEAGVPAEAGAPGIPAEAVPRVPASRTSAASCTIPA